MREVKIKKNKKGLAEVVAQHAHGNAEVKKRREKRVCAVAGEIWMDTGSGCFFGVPQQREHGCCDSTALAGAPSAKCTRPSREQQRPGLFQRGLSAATALLRALGAVESWLRLQRCINLCCFAPPAPTPTPTTYRAAPRTSTATAASMFQGWSSRCCTSCLIRPWRRSDCSKPPALWAKDQIHDH